MIKVGINYKQRFGQEILENLSKIDVLEVYTEKFFSSLVDSDLEAIMRRVPITMHGLDLSLGSSDGIDPAYSASLAQALRCNEHLWFSDHICMTKVNGVEVGHLMPIPFSEAQVESIVGKVKEIKGLSKRPFLLENITYYYEMPGSDLAEAGFISRILEKADVGMLLDVNNLWINSLNHGYDPLAYLDSLPLERITEIHLAGGSFKEGMYVDTHANAIGPQVWGLFEAVLSKTSPGAVIIERDSNIEVLGTVLDEVDLAKQIIRKYE